MAYINQPYLYLHHIIKIKAILQSLNMKKSQKILYCEFHSQYLSNIIIESSTLIQLSRRIGFRNNWSNKFLILHGGLFVGKC